MPVVTQAVAVNVSAGLVFPFGSATGVGRRCSITNNGPNAIYVGSSAVTVLNGFRIAAGGTFTFSEKIINGPIYAIADTALQVSPADTRIMVEVSD